MKKITKKSYLEQSRHPELARKVLRQMGADWKDIVKYPMNYRDPQGGVSGFVWFNETEPFAKRNIELILDAVGDFEEETGCSVLSNMGDNKLNWLAWFALETVIQEIIDITECDG